MLSKSTCSRRAAANRIDAAIRLRVICSQRGDHAAALRQIYAALKINRNDADALNNRGIVLKELKRLHEALASYDQAIALSPGHADAFINRGNVLLELKRLDEALLSFDPAIALKPGHADAFNNRGNVLMELVSDDAPVSARYRRRLEIRRFENRARIALAARQVRMVHPTATL